MPNRAFRPNRPAVASEVFEDEAVLVHFERGHYFSLDGMARAAWERLSEGAADAEDLADRFEQVARGERSLMLEAAERFLTRLVELDLVVEAEVAKANVAPALDGALTRAGAAADAPTTANDARASSNAERAEFREPRIEIFTDLEDLLVLDPIHDVAPDGWPAAPAGR